jgi:hypothetical protein
MNADNARASLADADFPGRMETLEQAIDECYDALDRGLHPEPVH